MARIKTKIRDQRQFERQLINGNHNQKKKNNCKKEQKIEANTSESIDLNVKQR